MLRKLPISMLCVVFSALLLSAGPWNRASAQTAPLFVTHVAVVDVIAGRVQPDMTVEIRGRTISAVSAGRPLRIPRRATVVDGRGEYLIPGLWDMHVHLSFPPGAAEIFLPLMVANGVLGARDMHSFLSTIVSLKHAVATGAQIGPRLFIAGAAAGGPQTYFSRAAGAFLPHVGTPAGEGGHAAGHEFL